MFSNILHRNSDAERQNKFQITEGEWSDGDYSPKVYRNFVNSTYFCPVYKFNVQLWN